MACQYGENCSSLGSILAMPLPESAIDASRRAKTEILQAAKPVAQLKACMQNWVVPYLTEYGWSIY
jgi:hypothetical protein